jgi:hypothetical protein
LFFFSAGRSTGDFLFCLPIFDRIESPTATVTTRLYFDLGVDSIIGPSSPSSPETSPTTSPLILICVPSSTPWRVLRRRRPDQPI